MDLQIIQKFIIWAIPVLFAITLHEVAHGWVALKFGDKTALMMGRLTVNPFKHIDMIGTVIVPTLLFFLGGFIFGWAKPVPVTKENLHQPKRDMAFVAMAGPCANLLMAFFWALVAKVGIMISDGNPQAGLDWVLIYMGQAGIIINLVLMILNIIPVPPLDGSRIVSSLIPSKMDYYYSRLEPYGFIILVLLLATGILGRIIGPPIIALLKLIVSLFGLPFIL